VKHVVKHVYVLMREMDYEGGMLEGVFSTQRLAILHAEKRDNLKHYNWAGNEDRFFNRDKHLGEELAIYKVEIDNDSMP
jgi:hypothetical protein